MPNAILLERSDGEKVFASNEQEIRDITAGIQNKLASYKAKLEAVHALSAHEISMAHVLISFWNNNATIIDRWNRENEVEALAGLKQAMSDIIDQDLGADKT